MSTRTEYADDALVMESDTTLAELKQFVERRTRNPYIMHGTLVWNFSSHQVDADALAKAAESKLTDDKYVIPFQVTGVWGYMTHLIPERVSLDSQVLVYLKDDAEYVEYNNLLTGTNGEEVDEFKTELEDDLSAFNVR